MLDAFNLNPALFCLQGVNDADLDAGFKLLERNGCNQYFAFAEPVKQGRIAEGFLAAIEILGNQLARHMPAATGNPNRLPDVLIELRG